MIDDLAKLVETYEACQKLSHGSKAPSQPLQLIAPSWPLQHWGIDIVGKLTSVHGNYTITIVAVEYFTKWVEVKPVTNITSATIKKFSSKILSVTMESRSRSQLTMPNTSTVTCSMISTTKLI
jgi:hypothetical protein